MFTSSQLTEEVFRQEVEKLVAPLARKDVNILRHLLMQIDALYDGAAGSMRQLATQLVDRANDAGGRDNVCVVLYQHQPS